MIAKQARIRDHIGILSRFRLMLGDGAEPETIGDSTLDALTAERILKFAFLQQTWRLEDVMTLRSARSRRIPRDAADFRRR